jgi:hypothetical protein
MGDGLTRGSGRRRIKHANPVPGDTWATPERPSEREGQNRVEEWPSVVPAGGFSLDSVFGVGSNPVAAANLRIEPSGENVEGLSC